ncbi:MAG TPA: RNA polymerase sigma factor, partial [Arenibacter sp.]|nr:RNA polymerase sigma factor [Arenibacter sp.]
MKQNIFTSGIIQSNVSLDGNKFDFLSDKDLWEAFKKGDEGAFIRIYNTYFEVLCDFGVQYVSLNIVEDAVQDLFIDLRKDRLKLPQIKNTILLFLFQCLKRRIFNILRKENRMGKENILDPRFGITPCHESVIILNQEQKLKLERLDKALTGLNERQREAIYYYFYKGMTYDEVKELLGFK